MYTRIGSSEPIGTLLKAKLTGAKKIQIKEYGIEVYGTRPMELLNALADEGWEVAGIGGSCGNDYLLKRPRPE